MIKYCLSTFFGTVLLVVSIASPGRAALPAIIEDGKPNAEIVISETPARVSKFAAKELQSYLEKITGAKLPIVTSPGDSKVQIFVGPSAFTEKLGVSTEGLRHGAFQISSGPNWLALVGPDKDYVPIEPWGRMRSPEETERVNKEWDKITGDTFWNNFNELGLRYDKDRDLWDFDDMGTLNAVYEYLRSLGVRWFAPGELGEVVPEKKTVFLPDWNESFVPDFPLRSLRYFHPWANSFEEIRLWNLRLGLNPGHDLIGITQSSHGIKFVIGREEMKQAHPEIYATVNGRSETTHKRTGVPALTSPLLFEKQLKYSRAVFDHFQEPMLSIDLVDGYGGIESDEKLKFSDPSRGWAGSMSEFVWEYLNRVALELHKSHPDRLVSGLSYSAYQEPPKNIKTMSPNLAIIECRWRSNFHNEEARKSSQKIREAWMKKLPSQKYFIADYYLHARPNSAGPPVVFPGLIAQDLRDLKGISSGDAIEVYNHPDSGTQFSYDPLAVDHLNIYVTSRLWWDTDQDLGALMQDYYTNYYGPAAEPMKAFFEYSEANWPFMGQDAKRITKTLDLLETARASVDPDSVYGQRIAKIVEYVQPLTTMREQLARKREGTNSFRVLPNNHAGATGMDKKPLNGRLDPDHWPPNARVTPLVPNIPGTPRGPGGRFQIFRENDILRFGIFCEEPDMANLNISTTKSGDPKIFEGDYVTILLETPTHSYYQIAVNPAGAVYEIDRGPDAPPLWRSGAQVAVHTDKDFWSVEVRLPIAGEGARVLDPATGVDGAAPTGMLPWYFNVGRQRVRDGEVQLTAYSPTKMNDFLVPERFAHMWAK